jgi:hypothetical protein
MQWTRERPDRSCSQLVCGVLWVQRTFYFLGLKFTLMLHSDGFRTPVHLRENVCVFRTALVHATKNSFRFWICLLQEAESWHNSHFIKRLTIQVQRTAVNALFHIVFTANIDTTKRALQVKTCDWEYRTLSTFATLCYILTPFVLLCFGFCTNLCVVYRLFMVM